MRVGPRCGGEPPEELLAAAADGAAREPPLPISPSGSAAFSLAELPPEDPPLAGPFLLAALALWGPARAEVEPATSASDRRAAAKWGRRTIGSRQLKRTACRAVNAGNLRFWNEFGRFGKTWGVLSTP